MNIASTPSVQSATAATQSPEAGAAQVLMLKKAMDLQAINAAAMIQALPKALPLASSGSVGRHLNTFA
jgi:stage V sporulation protein SpoVS